jgi:hypothetical protein
MAMEGLRDFTAMHRTSDRVPCRGRGRDGVCVKTLVQTSFGMSMA